MATENYPTTKYTAVVDGAETGLAGCSRKCKNCLRGHDMLRREKDMHSPVITAVHGCKLYIPMERV